MAKIGLLTETETEFIARSNARLVEVPVVDVKPFGVVVVTVDDSSAVVGCLFCNSVRKFAAWRGRAVQDVDEAVAQFLTGQARLVSNVQGVNLATILTQPIR